MNHNSVISLLFLIGLIQVTISIAVDSRNIFNVAIYDSTISDKTLAKIQSKFYPIFYSICKKINKEIKIEIDVEFRKQHNNSITRGLSYLTPRPKIIIYTHDGIKESQIIGIFSHELGHIFHKKLIGSSINKLLNEGFASWLAGDYYLKWQGYSSFSNAVLLFINDNTYLLLNRYLFEYPILDPTLRDKIYLEWASFVEYLIQAFGIDTFYKLLYELEINRVSQQLKNSDEIIENRNQLNKSIHIANISKDHKYKILCAAYMKVYGKTLDDLEKEWIKVITKKNLH